jgi:hypothetical protein
MSNRLRLDIVLNDFVAGADKFPNFEVYALESSNLFKGNESADRNIAVGIVHQLFVWFNWFYQFNWLDKLKCSEKKSLKTLI